MQRYEFIRKKHFSVQKCFFLYYYKLDNVHSLAQRTNQETSTPTKASPYMGRMQKENRRNRRFSLGFGIAGHAMGVYAAAIDVEGYYP